MFGEGVISTAAHTVSVWNCRSHISTCIKCSCSDSGSHRPSKFWQSGEWRNAAEDYPQLKKSSGMRSGGRGGCLCESISMDTFATVSSEEVQCENVEVFRFGIMACH